MKTSKTYMVENSSYVSQTFHALVMLNILCRHNRIIKSFRRPLDGIVRLDSIIFISRQFVIRIRFRVSLMTFRFCFRYLCLDRISLRTMLEVAGFNITQFLPWFFIPDGKTRVFIHLFPNETCFIFLESIYLLLGHILKLKIWLK